MRTLTIIGGIALATALLTPAFAEMAEPETPPAEEKALPFDIKDFPLDDDALRTLDRRHLRLARKSGNVCVANTAPSGFRFHTGSVTVPLNACNVFILDNLVAEEADPALSAYHYAMTPRRRYDQNRPSQYWRIVRKQVESGRPIPGIGKIKGLEPAEAEELSKGAAEAEADAE